MSVVFVHGVPETTRVWDELLTRLDLAEPAVLALPGFGSVLPDGFEPTMGNYAEWLAAELSVFDEVDLVTHDWGALLALRVLADAPVNVRSWVSDAGDLDDSFRWHDLALLWQSNEGEAFMEALLAASVADRAELLVASGVPARGAVPMAEAFDATMAQAILALYRSAGDIGREWGPGLDSIEARGLIIESMNDPYRSPDRARRLAGRTGSEVVALPDAGHWWMLDSPSQAAAVIAAFWSDQ